MYGVHGGHHHGTCPGSSAGLVPVPSLLGISNCGRLQKHQRASESTLSSQPTDHKLPRSPLEIKIFQNSEFLQAPLLQIDFAFLFFFFKVIELFPSLPFLLFNNSLAAAGGEKSKEKGIMVSQNDPSGPSYPLPGSRIRHKCEGCLLLWKQSHDCYWPCCPF